MKPTAYIRKSSYFYNVYEGHPKNHSMDAKVVGEYFSRRQAIRHAERNGYDVIIRGREYEKETGMDMHEINEDQNLDRNETLSIKLSSYDVFTAGGSDGVWLKLPADADELSDALSEIGAAGGVHGMDYFISNFDSAIPVIAQLPIENIRRVGIDELNYVAGQLERAAPDELEKLNATFEALGRNIDAKMVTEAVHNTGTLTHLPHIHTFEQLGEHYLKSNKIEMPEEWKGAVDVMKLGQIASAYENGTFTRTGYVIEHGGIWERFDGIPGDYEIEQLVIADSAGKRIAEPLMMYDAVAPHASNVRTAINGRKSQHTASSDKVRETLEELNGGIKDIFESGKYEKYLDTLSKFHNYSYANCMLIAMQKPDSTQVAGYSFWRHEMGRFVKQGEKGIKILAPSQQKQIRYVYKTGDDGKPVLDGQDKPVREREIITVTDFKVVSVFDVSQTDGEPLPSLGVNEILGDVRDYSDIKSVLERISPVPVDFEPITSGAKGFYDMENKRIVINDGMSNKQSIKTMLHEIAHSRLHDRDIVAPDGASRPDKRTREVEAESIAYTVSKHYGIDTSDYSFGYIAGWSTNKELPELKASLGTIRKEANSIINEADGIFQKLIKEKEKSVVYPRMTKAELQDDIKSEMQFHGSLTNWTRNTIAANGYKIDGGKFGTLVKDDSGAPRPLLEPRKPRAKKSNASKSAAQKKPSISAELAAAKKQAAAQKSTPSTTPKKSKSQGLEV